MKIDSARAFFEALAARGREPRLADAVGSWEFDVANVGSWTVAVDHGALRVAEGASPDSNARLRLDEGELVRLGRGEGHTNLLTAVLRGALVVEGELAFCQRLSTLLPLVDETEQNAGART